MIGGVRLGVVLPTLDLGPDPGAVRAFVLRAEALGFDDLHVWDHVAGIDRERNPLYADTFDRTDTFHEALTTLAWVAAVAPGLSLTTGILIAPQRQTVLVAKQAAQVDLFCGGRLRLGVGVGHAAEEYVALGELYEARGDRLEEQIGLFRRLWTEPSVVAEGRHDQLAGIGLNPQPVQRPIPVWIGGSSRPARRRLARLGDGWLARGRPDDVAAAMVEVRAEAASAGRDPARIGVDGRVDLWSPKPGLPSVGSSSAAWAEAVEAWLAIGVAQVTLHAQFGGLDVDGHLDLLERWVAAWPTAATGSSPHEADAGRS